LRELILLVESNSELTSYSQRRILKLVLQSSITSKLLDFFDGEQGVVVGSSFFSVFFLSVGVLLVALDDD